MKNLSLEKINSVSPYRVEFDSTTGLYKFVSDFGVNFGIAFEVNDLLLSGESYQFGLTNYEGKQSPRDPKVRETILATVEEFFAKNQAALLYICETGDGMQKCAVGSFLFGSIFIRTTMNISFCLSWCMTKKTMKTMQL